MSRKMFTTEEITSLRQNPFTLSVTSLTISFTKAFKQHFMDEYNNGKVPREIITNCGYSPEVLGDRRIWGISYHVRQEYNDTNGTFQKQIDRHSNTDKYKKQLSEKDELKLLRQRIDYLEQEMEFFKKISSIKTTGK